jgi:lipoyl(octanoyl) transferase
MLNTAHMGTDYAVPSCDLAAQAAPGSEHGTPAPLICQVRDLGLVRYADAFAQQQNLVARRKLDEIPDQLLFVEHPHVVTMGRSAHSENILASPELLERAGIELHDTDRGGDVTYHGPGQLVGYPIMDLRKWKRDVVAYVRGLEQVLIDTLGEFGIATQRVQGATGVWTTEGKIAAIGVHISRWVTSHGFALNVETDLNYFRYIVPCGLTKPVTSMHALGVDANRAEVTAALARNFGRVFDRNLETI